MISRLLKQLQTLPAETRSLPFWAWNAKLEPAQLVEQIRAMHQMGFGGFFMHSRFGLETEYLSREWFDCVKLCIDEAEQLGMHAWLYDEDRWPSGTAGGKVTFTRKYAMRGLEYAIGNTADFQPGDLAWFALSGPEKSPDSWRRLAAGEGVKEGECFIRFFVKMVDGAPDCNNQPYLDTGNPEAVAQFLRVTHEAYREKLGDDFKHAPGIFTDEPEYRAFRCKHLWTQRLPEQFEKRYHYDLLDHLPELFFDSRDRQTSGVRLDFYNLACDLFTTAYARQIGTWCDEHKMAFTGHVLGEDDPVSQTLAVGSAMRFYEFMQIPGIDVLGEHWNLFGAAKQCASVAHQLGKKQRLCELYGCTGWDFPLEGHKAIGDWLAALGINVHVPHHFWYSMRGESKRDYPASISPISPWHTAYRKVEDYFARIHAVLSEGTERRNILVIHPIESIWFGRPLGELNREWTVRYGYFVHKDERVLAQLTKYQQLIDALLGAHLDFDYGDEAQLTRYAKINDRMLAVGEADYQTVVIPELLTIRTTTLTLLRAFAARGGKVFYLGAIPEFADGKQSDLPRLCYGSFTALTSCAQLGEALSEFREVSLAVHGEEQRALLYNLHTAEDCSALFVCNTSMEPCSQIHEIPAVAERTLAFPEIEISWKLPETWRIFELDLDCGIFRLGESVYREGRHCFKSSFHRLESRMFLAVPGDVKIPYAPSEVPEPKSAMIEPELLGYATDEENVLVLDLPEVSVKGEAYRKAELFLTADDRIRTEFGMPLRRISMPQPYWLAKNPCGDERVQIPVALRYRFQCGALPQGGYLGIEDPDKWRIVLNGQELSRTDCGMWKCASVRKLRLPSLRRGENCLELFTQYRHDSALESLFLLGDFGVDGEGALTSLPERLRLGDWTKQGFPEYAGNMTYAFGFEHRGGEIELEIPQWRAVALGVVLNGEAERVVAWEPYRVRLTAKAGWNDLKIVVYGHLRNAFGPFYPAEVPYLITPAAFRAFDIPEKKLVPCGLFSPVRIADIGKEKGRCK
ncbi:MAG: glycosyl hydrolase [Victivallaceae bacterium]|nr:glycosyl hydrolase [Victivallaceae bacterium]